METAIKRFVGKVLSDGHLSLPDDTAKEVGNVYEVVLIPIDELDAYSYAASLAKGATTNNMVLYSTNSIVAVSLCMSR